MAKVSITVDTEKKEVEVTVGSQKIDNVSDVYISTDAGGYFGLEICQRGELEGMRQTTRLYASATDKEWLNKEEELITSKELAQALGLKVSE